MTNVTSSDLSSWVGRTAIDRAGDKIGKIADIYIDDDTGDPEWLAVSTGLFGTKVSFVPIEGADLRGDDIVVAYDKATVKDAPNAETDGALSPEEEDRLYRHYGQSYGAGTGVAGDVDRDRDRAVDSRTRATEGYDTSGPETDDAMTRSEEELRVDKQTRQAGAARLRKWIEAENVTINVPVTREKARLVTEPITAANEGAAMSGADLTTEEHEVVLSEEVVDVDRRVVPKERVRLEKETVTDEVAVDETVRKERIGYEGEDVQSSR